MKFGKQIQKKQLEIPEYAASFVDYKGLKRLIKELKLSPTTQPGSLVENDQSTQDPQLVLQANKGSFFFRLDRELDKVNAFYTVKESESRVRLQVLRDKQRLIRLRHPVISRTSTQYVTLEQGFRDFIRDLSKLQQFIEINATAFSKILKKWDKTSKSQTKEQYLSRAVEVQPVFNRDVISDLSDQASASLLDCAAWAEGEEPRYGNEPSTTQSQITPRLEQTEADSDLLDFLYRGDVPSLRGLLSRFDSSPASAERITRAFLTAISQAPEASLDVLLATDLVDWTCQDEINDRNCLHKIAMSGRRRYVQAALEGGIDPSMVDAYGRIPLHYAAMNGHTELLEDLVHAKRDTVDVQDLDNFTPLIHAIVRGNLECVENILSFSPKVDRLNDSGHIPLNLACQQGSLSVVSLLLQQNPHIIPDAEGLFPQHLVARFGTDSRLLLLLQNNGADLNQPDKLYGWTPLFHAASEGRVACLKTLLDCGVPIDVRDEKGQPALYYAAWEGHLQCMRLLSPPTDRLASQNAPPPSTLPEIASKSIVSSGVSVEQIPDLALPPPIIPTRRYGHNFLENKSTVLVIFGEGDSNAVTFYDESKYPAARLTITPRPPDILPRNLLLPIQEEYRCISFETDTVEGFAIEFDVYPTFGKKVIAKGSVPSDVFQSGKNSSGHHYLSLFDPRLRVVGQMSFKFQVIRPFQSLPIGGTSLNTYWKATSQSESKPSSLVTGSSLSGDYVRISVQSSQDLVPVVYPHWWYTHNELSVPVSHLTCSAFQEVCPSGSLNTTSWLSSGSFTQEHSLSKLQWTIHKAHLSLEQVLESLPTTVNLDVHILFPSEQQERNLHVGPTPNINDFADSILSTVFKHTRKSRDAASGQTRSLMFSSYNTDFCTAMNWKQPNYPVLLCNSLGRMTATHSPSSTKLSFHSRSADQILPNEALSIKEAVRVATTNNFMGLICCENLLRKVPALVEAIKVAGLVLVSDASLIVKATHQAKPGSPGSTAEDVSVFEALNGVNGVLKTDGVLAFRDAVEV